MAFDGVPLHYRQAVLSVLGAQLKRLKFKWCPKIYVITELFPLSQLEELLLFLGSTVHLDAEFPSTDAFLPNLETFYADCCLGKWSPLFECYRPSLEKFIPACLHFGMTDRSPFKWNDIPQLFPNFSCLSISRSEGLSMDVVSDILLKMKSLQLVHLSHPFFSKDDRQIISKLALQSRNREPVGPAIGFHLVPGIAHN